MTLKWLPSNGMPADLNNIGQWVRYMILPVLTLTITSLAGTIRYVHVDNWKSAIELAAKPLLEEGTIEQTYVDQMIASVEEHGPYIVLADEFALPHASAASGVHELSMSLLIVKEPVDLLGKPVRLFMVLATIDNSSHMKALASLTEILYDDANMKLFQSGDISAIMKLIQDKG